MIIGLRNRENLQLFKSGFQAFVQAWRIAQGMETTMVCPRFDETSTAIL